MLKNVIQKGDPEYLEKLLTIYSSINDEKSKFFLFNRYTKVVWKNHSKIKILLIQSDSAS